MDKCNIKQNNSLVNLYSPMKLGNNSESGFMLAAR